MKRKLTNQERIERNIDRVVVTSGILLMLIVSGIIFAINL